MPTYPMRNPKLTPAEREARKHLFEAIEKSDSASLKRILKVCPKLASLPKTMLGIPPLSAAVLRASLPQNWDNIETISCIELLLEAGADLERWWCGAAPRWLRNYCLDEELMGPPLYLACLCGWLDGMRLLLNHGAAVDARYNSSSKSSTTYLARTVLMEAMYCGFPEGGQLLLERGADANAISGNELWTPLHYAAVGACPREATTLLIGASANVRARDADGKEAVDLARENGRFEVANILLAEEHRLRALEAKKAIEQGIESGRASAGNRGQFALPIEPIRRPSNIL